MFSANTSQVAAGAAAVNYIEDVFSTYLYAGSNSTQTITNGIDLSTYGGLVWTKARTTTYDHFLTDTIRGGNKQLSSNNTGASVTSSPAEISSFNTDGYTLAGGTVENVAGQNFVGWTFREQPKFFDVVTFTTNSSGGATGTHSLGSTPGAVFIKNTASAEDWLVWHTSIGDNFYIVLNSPSAKAAATGWISPSSSALNIANSSLAANTAYVAYVFAHNAGGFGLTGTDNVISCGSVATTNSQQDVSLGYEPQWILWKRADSTGSWWMFDTMRGLVVDGGSGTGDKALFAELANAELGTAGIDPTATGFQLSAGWGAGTYIYIAIRRGPMKVPTSGTSVFSPNAYTGGTAGTSFNLGFVPDTLLTMRRNTSNFDILQARLLGQDYAFTNDTGTYQGGTTGIPAWDANTGTTKLTTATAVTGWNRSGSTYVNEAFARAPSFFDVVCYTGTGVNGRAISHNLGVAPELAIVKSRNNPDQWWVFSSAFAQPADNYFILNGTLAVLTATGYGFTTTSTTFTPSPADALTANASGFTYVAYLFATCSGVSKVGSYTGTGATQTIDCGFTGGARFVMIKRTNDTGDWRVWDTARGMVAGTDPNLFLNTTDAEANVNAVYTTTGGFQIVATGTGINASGSTYLFLAIA